MSSIAGKFTKEHYTEHGIPSDILESAYPYDPENHWACNEDILPFQFGVVALRPATSFMMRNRKLGGKLKE